MCNVEHAVYSTRNYCVIPFYWLLHICKFDEDVGIVSHILNVRIWPFTTLSGILPRILIITVFVSVED